MSRPRTLVLFDVDGTLIDSQSYFARHGTGVQDTRSRLAARL